MEVFETTKTKRLFIAVDMPEQVIEQALLIQQKLKESRLFLGKFTEQSGLHMTLKFLGDVALDTIDTIDKRLQTITIVPLSARVGVVDLFSAGSKIKIIFLHIICPALEQLVANIEGVLSDQYPKESRKFIPHITLARVKEVPDRRALLTTLNAFTISSLSFTIDSFMLKQSILSPQGPRYFNLKHYTLS